FLMAGMEYKSLRIHELLKKTSAGDLMRTQFSMIAPEDTYEKIITLYTRAGEKNFLVFRAPNDVIGSIPEMYIKDVIKRGQVDLTAKQLMNPHFGIFPSHTSLEYLMNTMQAKGM